jgi:hypothetical protein
VAEKDRKRLINRLESLIKSVEEGPQLAEQYGSVRYRPFFQTYNSCVKEFKYFCEQEYERLELEALPLYDDQGREQFTNRKISTLLHQSREILAILNSLEPKVTPIWLIRNRDRIHWKRWPVFCLCCSLSAWCKLWCPKLAKENLLIYQISHKPLLVFYKFTLLKSDMGNVMPTKKPRVIFVMDDNLLKRIDDFRYQN